MRTTLLLIVFLAGCAGLSESECRSADWYALGKRDGEIYGSRAMIDQYAKSCSVFGVKPDEKQYMVGWDDGNMEYRQRTGWGGGDM